MDLPRTDSVRTIQAPASDVRTARSLTSRTSMGCQLGRVLVEASTQLEQRLMTAVPGAASSDTGWELIITLLKHSAEVKGHTTRQVTRQTRQVPLSCGINDCSKVYGEIFTSLSVM